VGGLGIDKRTGIVVAGVCQLSDGLFLRFAEVSDFIKK
jgi:hypothetical protein